MRGGGRPRPGRGRCTRRGGLHRLPPHTPRSAPRGGGGGDAPALPPPASSSLPPLPSQMEASGRAPASLTLTGRPRRRRRRRLLASPRSAAARSAPGNLRPSFPRPPARPPTPPPSAGRAARRPLPPSVPETGETRPIRGSAPCTPANVRANQERRGRRDFLSRNGPQRGGGSRARRPEGREGASGPPHGCV